MLKKFPLLGVQKREYNIFRRINLHLLTISAKEAVKYNRVTKKCINQDEFN